MNESLYDWKSGEFGGRGKRIKRLRSEATGHASSWAAAIVSVIPLRKGSVFDAERERYNLSVFKRADCLVK